MSFVIYQQVITKRTFYLVNPRGFGKKGAVDMRRNRVGTASKIHFKPNQHHECTPINNSSSVIEINCHADPDNPRVRIGVASEVVSLKRLTPSLPKISKGHIRVRGLLGLV